MAAAREKDRITIRLNGELGEIINELVEKTPAQSPTDVVRRALVVYHQLAQAHLAGSQLLIITEEPSGNRKREPIFL
ncbi:hypothetical protein [Antarctobacter heliothermus]|nr:hypothetical protein [Antarctobacter heliothermus]